MGFSIEEYLASINAISYANGEQLDNLPLKLKGRAKEIQDIFIEGIDAALQAGNTKEVIDISKKIYERIRNIKPEEFENKEEAFKKPKRQKVQKDQGDNTDTDEDGDEEGDNDPEDSSSPSKPSKKESKEKELEDGSSGQAQEEQEEEEEDEEEYGDGSEETCSEERDESETSKLADQGSNSNNEDRPITKLPDLSQAIQESMKKAIDDIRKESSVGGMRDYYLSDKKYDSTQEEPTDIRDHNAPKTVPDIVVRNAAPIAAKLRAFIKAPRSKWLKRLDKGGIDPKRVAKFISCDSKTVFRTRTLQKDRNTCIMLLVDASGSMMGSKWMAARQASQILAEACKRAGIPCRVTGFTSGSYGKFAKEINDEQSIYRQPAYSEYTKALEDIVRSGNERKELLDTYLMSDWGEGYRICKTPCLGNTPDGESLEMAAQYISKRSERRKIIFVLSDGSPGVGLIMNPNLPGVSMTKHLKRIINETRKSGIEVYGIGFGYNYAKNFYGQNTPIYNPSQEAHQSAEAMASELGKVILTTVDNIIRGKGAQ